MRELGRLVRKVAASDTTALILGETGSGKERIARAVHHLSTRASQRFVAVNAAGLPNGVTNPLVNQLRATQRDGSSPQACKKLDDFIHLVGVKDGSTPDAASADWTARAQNIQAVLGCRPSGITKSLLTGAVPTLNSRGSRGIVKQ